MKTVLEEVTSYLDEPFDADGISRGPEESALDYILAEKIPQDVLERLLGIPEEKLTSTINKKEFEDLEKWLPCRSKYPTYHVHLKNIGNI